MERERKRKRGGLLVLEDNLDTREVSENLNSLSPRASVPEPLWLAKITRNTSCSYHQSLPEFKQRIPPLGTRGLCLWAFFSSAFPPLLISNWALVFFTI